MNYLQIPGDGNPGIGFFGIVETSGSALRRSEKYGNDLAFVWFDVGDVAFSKTLIS
jgi:hypothetical protein